MLRKDGARGIMRNPIAVLKSLTEKSKDVNYKFQRLYRNLYNPEFYWLAYKNIYANKGSMTAGVDGSTMDNMSDSRIEKIINSLKDHSYKPNPARREYISKKNSKKKRPLGIPSGDDKTTVVLAIAAAVTTGAALFLMIALMLPAFLLAMYEKDGLPFEKVVRNVVRACFLWPGTRPYKTGNFYAILEKEDQTIGY